MSDLPRRLEAARLAVSRACDICREVQHELASIRTLIKDDRSPVSVADFASQAVVAHTLTEALGRATIVAEEDARELRRALEEGRVELPEAVLHSVQNAWPGATMAGVLDAIDLGAADPPEDDLHGFWTLDPIDGTKGFLRGGQYAVSLAWIEQGAPVIGVLGCPNLSKDFTRPLDDPDPHGVIYYAVAAEGLCEVPADDPAAPPLVIRRLEPAEGEPVRLCESIESEHTSHDESEMILERVGEPAEPIRLDGQGKYAVVARGQADVYLRLPKSPPGSRPGDKSGYVEKIWDHAAGALVAMEAGCAVTDILGNELDFGCGRRLEKNRGIVVAAPALHGRVLAAMRAVGVE